MQSVSPSFWTFISFPFFSASPQVLWDFYKKLNSYKTTSPAPLRLTLPVLHPSDKIHWIVAFRIVDTCAHIWISTWIPLYCPSGILFLPDCALTSTKPQLFTTMLPGPRRVCGHLIIAGRLMRVKTKANSGKGWEMSNLCHGVPKMSGNGDIRNLWKRVNRGLKAVELAKRLRNKQ